MKNKNTLSSHTISNSKESIQCNPIQFFVYMPSTQTCSQVVIIVVTFFFLLFSFQSLICLLFFLFLRRRLIVRLNIFFLVVFLLFKSFHPLVCIDIIKITMHCHRCAFYILYTHWCWTLKMFSALVPPLKCRKWMELDGWIFKRQMFKNYLRLSQGSLPNIHCRQSH